MAYTHLTMEELIFIEKHFFQKTATATIAKRLNRSRQPVTNVINFLKGGGTAISYYRQYKENKRNCGRKRIVIPEDEVRHINEKADLKWSPDVIINSGERSFSIGVRTLYRRFEEGEFSSKKLYMKGKRKRNGEKEKRGRQAFTRNISTRTQAYPEFNTEFGHLEGDTIVGQGRKSCVITLVERQTKAIITLKPAGRKAIDIQESLDQWLTTQPRNLYKSITFDCGKEFSNWRATANNHDIAIFFADPGTPSQRGLNEHSNGLLRKSGLPKQMDFTNVEESLIQEISEARNHIPRKSLGYSTPAEVLQKNIDEYNLRHAQAA